MLHAPFAHLQTVGLGLGCGVGGWGVWGWRVLHFRHFRQVESKDFRRVKGFRECEAMM